MTQLMKKIVECLQQKGYEPTEVLQDECDPQAFGNTVSVLRVGRMLLQGTRDRGDEFIHVGLISPTGELEYFSSEDVEAALGSEAEGNARVTAEQAFVDLEDLRYPLGRILDLLSGVLGDTETAGSRDVFIRMAAARNARLLERERNLRNHVLPKRS